MDLLCVCAALFIFWVWVGNDLHLFISWWFLLERGQSNAVKEQDFFHAVKGRPFSWRVTCGGFCEKEKGVVRRDPSLELIFSRFTKTPDKELSLYIRYLLQKRPKRVGLLL